MKNTSGIIALVIVIMAAIACSSDDTQKANALVDEANAFLRTANASVANASKLGDDLDATLAAMKGKTRPDETGEVATELLKEYDGMAENFRKAADKFDEASKLNIKEKHKEYLETKAKELNTRADYSTELKKIPADLIRNDDKAKFQELLNSTMDKVQSLTKEAQELSDKADTIVRENPDVMQQGEPK
jgi:hypothetical protein